MKWSFLYNIFIKMISHNFGRAHSYSDWGDYAKEVVIGWS